MTKIRMPFDGSFRVASPFGFRVDPEEIQGAVFVCEPGDHVPGIRGVERNSEFQDFPVERGAGSLFRAEIGLQGGQDFLRRFRLANIRTQFYRVR